MADDAERFAELETEHPTVSFESVRAPVDEDDVPLETETIVGMSVCSTVDFAGETNGDRITLGSHGRSGVSRALPGVFQNGSCVARRCQ